MTQLVPGSVSYAMKHGHNYDGFHLDAATIRYIGYIPCVDVARRVYDQQQQHRASLRSVWTQALGADCGKSD